jgi:hypothetical protein
MCLQQREASAKAEAKAEFDKQLDEERAKWQHDADKVRTQPGGACCASIGSARSRSLAARPRLRLTRRSATRRPRRWCALAALPGTCHVAMPLTSLLPRRQVAEQLEAALEASRSEAAEVAKLRAELAAAISSAEEAVKAKERAEELRLQVC